MWTTTECSVIPVITLAIARMTKSHSVALREENSVAGSDHSARQRDVPSETRPKYLSPPRLFASIALTVFFGEVAVMFVLASLPESKARS